MTTKVYMLPGCDIGRRNILSLQISAQTPKARLVEVVYYILTPLCTKPEYQTPRYLNSTNPKSLKMDWNVVFNFDITFSSVNYNQHGNTLHNLCTTLFFSCGFLIILFTFWSCFHLSHFSIRVLFTF